MMMKHRGIDSAECSSASFDPNRVLKPEQLEAFDFLAQPIWVFDFVERRNRWANSAGLSLWEASTLEEFLSRDTAALSPASEGRTRKVQHRIEQGKCVEEQWIIYPPNSKKAKTIQLSVTGLKLNAEEDHSCMLCCVVPLGGNTTFSTTIEPSFTSSLMCSSSRSSIPLSISPVFAECTPLGAADALQKETNETLRSRAIVKNLPISVCQFDLKGKLILQNPASIFAPPPPQTRTDEKEEGEDATTTSDDDVESISTMSVSRRSVDHRGEALEENTMLDNNDFTDRFVNPEVARAALKTIQGVQEEANLQAELYTAHGSQWSAIQLRKMLDPVTRRPVILFTSQDKSDAVEAKREREARIQKSEFLAIMAHEIRTPLHQVIGFADLLGHTRLSSEQNSFLKLLKSSSQGLLTVISDVLDYSKLEAGQMKFERISYEPLSVLQGSMAAMRSSCEEKGLYLTMTWNKNIPFRIMGDPNRLRQILLNLLSNAIKFTTNGGIQVDVLFIEVAEKDENSNNSTVQSRRRSSTASTKSSSNNKRSWIKFVVTDTGCGIPKKCQKTIFEKYQQGDLSVARKYGGTGLGLSICQSLANAMNGSIGVDSHEGHGSSFYVALPADLPEDCPSTTSDESETTTLDEMDNTTLNILLAEDNRINQKLMKNMFKRFGYELSIAQNGEEAIEMVKEGNYDVVFMDIQMPVMDGLEATRRLRSMGYNDLSIYGLTASVKQSDFADLGFDDWLPKPIPMADLKAKLVKLLKSKRRAEEYP